MRHPRLAPWVVAGCTAAFGVAIALRDLVNPWLSNAGVAAVALALSAWILGSRLGELMVWRLRGALVAAGLGVLLVAATHVGYRIAVAGVPALELVVAELYRDIAARPPWLVTALAIALVVAAEEVLWRGVAVEILGRRFSPRGVIALAPILYAVPQLIGGAWILLAAALALGLVFTAQRLRGENLTEPFLTHIIWSLSVFHVAPLV